MPLRIVVATGSSVPIYRQVVEQVRLAAATGRAKAGDALPSVRTLAEELVVNPNTIAKAYGELVREGIAEAQPGRGVFIAAKRSVYSRAERARRVEGALEEFIHEAVCLGMPEEEIRALFEKRLSRADFKQGEDKP
ncbi:MAG: GntR family transcriptional regulator [Planctomycetota bacterium]|nr:GntR family transcriptional regulator [Planctomycetota bacterium]